jgi:uncharacterized protein (DUF4213/DUF364 family)
MDNTRTVTDAKQQKIKIKKDVITSSMSTIVDRTCYVFFTFAELSPGEYLVSASFRIKQFSQIWNK